MSSIHPRRITCPLCGASLDGWLVLASRDRGPTTSDLRRIPLGEDPLPRMLNACADCGMVGEVSDFEEHFPGVGTEVAAALAGAFFSVDAWEDAHDPMRVDRPLDSGGGPAGAHAAPAAPSTLSAEIARHLKPQAGRAVAEPAFRWEARAQVVRWCGLGPLREGDAWMRAAWMHGDSRRETDERRCRRMALLCYRRGIEERRWFRRREDLVVVTYLCGELHRRLGDGDEARRCYEQAVAWASGVQPLQDLVALCERQARDPRDLL